MTLTKPYPALAAALLALCPAAAATPDRTLNSLVLADVISVEDISPPLQEGEIRIDGAWRATLRVRKLLAGQETDKLLILTRWSGQPRRVPIYAIVTPTADKPEIAWWAPTDIGVCLGSEAAASYGLVEPIARLRKAHPCRIRDWTAE